MTLPSTTTMNKDHLIILSSGRQVSIDNFCRPGSHTSLVVFKIRDFPLFEALYGGETAHELSEALEKFIWKAVPDIVANGMGLIALEKGEFLLVLEGRKGEKDSLLDLAFALKLRVQNELRHAVIKKTGQELDILLGYSSFLHTGNGSWEGDFIHELNRARGIAQRKFEISHLKMAEEFRAILRNSSIRIVFQPIIDLSSSEIFGWESLSRGPVNSPFESPLLLFDFAEEMGELFELERTCRRRALDEVGKMAPGQKLFLNIHPRALVDPKFTPGRTLEMIGKHGLKAENIVFEITERHSVKDFSLFHKALEHYRRQGFLVAIDDVGTGHSGLWSLAEIRPDFIKIDRSLIRHIESNPVKRALLETFVTFSEKIGSRIIAEGIEKETELTSVVSMGVHFGQGYYIALPQNPKPSQRLVIESRRRVNETNPADLSWHVTIGNLVETAVVVDETMPASEVKELMESDTPLSSVVVLRKGEPVGLVMSHHLDHHLASRYGVSLYYNRPISLIMDETPLTVPHDTPVEIVARKAMERETYRTYDDIIVLKEGRLDGVVSVQRMIDAMAKVHLEMAKGTNPLTGLPGNVVIERMIERDIALGKPFTLIYADLDNFKVYNDTYGFKNGDMILMLLARIMGWALKRHGNGNDFLGHIGGDDFVIVTTQERAERVSLAVVRCFGRLIRGFYNREDLQRGWILAQGRDGREGQFPLVSVSLGIMNCVGPCTLNQISERSAEIKKYAKSFEGNTFVRDRRAALGGD
jgi:EAL domain-containing protein (putative c-di-GMP-specific phosphodiesterase class I)/GGDEF domain-containing protein